MGQQLRTILSRKRAVDRDGDATCVPVVYSGGRESLPFAAGDGVFESRRLPASGRGLPGGSARRSIDPELCLSDLCYHALDGYLEHLASTDQWVRVEQLYVNLVAGRREDLVDPPDVLARIAKELIQQAVQRQAEVTAAMALDWMKRW